MTAPSPAPPPDLAANSAALDLRVRKGVWRTLLIVLVMLLVAELVSQALASGLPNPEWNFAQTDLKVAEMQALAEADETADVVLIGNSSVNAAFTVEDVAAQAGIDRIYNAGLDGSSVRQMEDWTLNVVVPLVQPEVVVIGLTSRDLNDASISNAEVFDKYFNSTGRARFMDELTLGQRFQNTMGDISALVRISPFLRDPASLVTQYDPGGAFDGAFVLPGEDYAPRQLDFTRTRERALNDYELGGIELESMERLVSGLETQGIRVVVMEMPYIEDDYIPLHPNEASDYEAFRQAATLFAQNRGLAYIDLAQYPWTTGEFYDFLHVNSTGIEIINSLLAEELAELL